MYSPTLLKERSDKGRNVVLRLKKLGALISLKDGVTVAKEIEREDPIENMGAQMVKEVASKNADIAVCGYLLPATVLAPIYHQRRFENVAAVLILWIETRHEKA